MSKDNPRLDFVSLFSGAGGLDLGLEYAGWHCLYAAYNEPSAVASLKRLIGNAVPPSLAKALGGELAKSVQSERLRKTPASAILELPKPLAQAIEYTKKEQARNGKSRRSVPNRRRERLVS